MFQGCQTRYQFSWLVFNRSISRHQMRIDIVNNSMLDVRKLAKHVKQHSPSADERLNIIKLLPLQISRQMLAKL